MENSTKMSAFSLENDECNTLFITQSDKIIINDDDSSENSLLDVVSKSDLVQMSRKVPLSKRFTHTFLMMTLTYRAVIWLFRQKGNIKLQKIIRKLMYF